MNVVSVVEHESLPIRDRIANGGTLSKATADALLQMEPRLPPGTLRWDYRSVRFQQNCGVIRVGDTVIEILPKIYGLEERPGACRESLVRMLRDAGLVRTHSGTAGPIAYQRHTLLDVFISLFCRRLQAEARNGLIHTYVGLEDDLPVLRGRLLVDAQLKSNAAHPERLRCRYDEFTRDNAFNQLLRYTLGILMPLCTSLEVRRQISNTLLHFEGVRARTFARSEAHALRLSRLHHRFSDIFDSARRFIDGLFPDVVAGKATCFTMLFDMNRLFESYTAAAVRHVCHKSGRRVWMQGPQKYFATRKETGTNVFLLKPDITIGRGQGEVQFVADAKWKILAQTEHNLDMAQGDLYQLAAYASRYGVQHAIIFYPRQRGLTRPAHIEFIGSTNIVMVVPVDVTQKDVGRALEGLDALLGFNDSTATVAREA